MIQADNRADRSDPGPSPDKPAPEEASRARLLAVVLVLVTFGLFARVLKQSFVDWDDPLHVVENPLLNPISAGHLAQFWKHSYCGLYIPVAYMAFAALAYFARATPPIVDSTNWVLPFDPRIFHAASLLLHALNALLVYWLLLRIVRRPWPAFAGALIFAIHPIQVEAVAWISELRGLLSACFALLCIHFYLAHRQRGGPSPALWSPAYGAATVCFALAALSKPGIIVLPIVLVAIDWTLAKIPATKSLATVAPWLILGAGLALLTHNVQPMDPAAAAPLGQRPVIALDAAGFYASKLLWPARLAADYGRTPHVAASHPVYAIGGLVLLAVTALAWRLRTTKPEYLASCLIFGILLLPVLGIVPFEFQRISTVGDRYVYLAMLGPALATACFLSTARTRAAGLIAAGAIAAFAAAAAVQVRVWDSCDSLYTHAIAVNPQTALMRYNDANVLKREGKLNAALVEYRLAIKNRPGYAEAYSNAANTMLEQGRVHDAIAYYKIALALKPSLPQAHHNLAIVMLHIGDLTRAENEARAAIRQDPRDPSNHEELSRILAARSLPAPL